MTLIQKRKSLIEKYNSIKDFFYILKHIYQTKHYKII